MPWNDTDRINIADINIYNTGGITTMIGEALAQAMRQKRLDRNQVAKLLDITPGYVSHLLNNRKNPSFELALKLIREFGISIDALALSKSNIKRLAKTQATLSTKETNAS
jgi:transcriptional regulator with XRE-family HTH domain